MRSKSRKVDTDLFTLAVLIATFGFIYAYHRVNGLLVFGFTPDPLTKETLGHYFDFTIGPPFLYRCLIPALGAGLLRVTGASAFVVVSLLEWCGATLAFGAFAALVHQRTKSVAMATLGSFALLGCLCLTTILPRYIPFFYVYDTWSLAAICALLWLYFTDRPVALWIGLIVATLIRETAIFVPIFIFLDRPKTRANILISAGHAATWLAVRFVVVNVIFRQGKPFQKQWPENIQFFVTDGSAWRAMVFVATIGFYYVLVGRLARQNPKEFGPYFALALIFGAGMFYVANLFEYRVFTELIPFVLLPILVTQYRAIRAEAS